MNDQPGRGTERGQEMVEVELPRWVVAQLQEYALLGKSEARNRYDREDANTTARVLELALRDHDALGEQVAGGVYATVYTDENSTGGFEIGGVYTTRPFAESIVEDQADADGEWENADIEVFRV